MKNIMEKWLKEDGLLETPINGDIHIHGNIIINHIIKDETNKKEKHLNKTQEARRKPQMKKWANKIKSRDGSCQCCGGNDKLEAHHIHPLSKFPDLGLEEGNGIALCHKCHQKYHNMYQGEENANNFSKYMRDFANRIYR